MDSTRGKNMLFFLIGIIAILAVVMTYILISLPPQSQTSVSTQTNVSIYRFTNESAVDHGDGTVQWPFTVIIENTGSTDAHGLRVTVQILVDDSVIDSVTTNISELRAGWSQTCSLTCWTYDDNWTLGKQVTYIATLRWGNSVIDEITL
ncbi:MAG: hypothetical protein JSW72_08580 [Candidatus Bathyarchaeota archaeon]|nr:MAG: hypothetical protein JSW72_08580 [Candidatus Bathyarchaeota archaeon]